MNHKLASGALALALAAAPVPAAAQQAPESVQKGCRDAAAQIARLYMNARKRGVKDLEQGVYKPSSNWAEQVAHYMAQALSRSDSLTESELATLGAAYCIERRPTVN